MLLSWAWLMHIELHDLLHCLFGLVGACSPSLALFFVLHEGCSCFGSCLGVVVPFRLVFGCPLLLSRCMSPADCSSADCWCALHGSCNLDVFFAVVFSCWALSSLFFGMLVVLQLSVPTAQAFWGLRIGPFLWFGSLLCCW